MKILPLTILSFFFVTLITTGSRAASSTNAASSANPAKTSASAKTTSATTAVPAVRPGLGSAPADPNALTPQEWAKVQQAREAAIKANPELMKKAMELAEKMRAFQYKLDQAIVDTDPKVAPTIAKLEHRQAAPPSAPANGVPAVNPPGR